MDDWLCFRCGHVLTTDELAVWRREIRVWEAVGAKARVLCAPCNDHVRMVLAEDPIKTEPVTT